MKKLMFLLLLSLSANLVIGQKLKPIEYVCAPCGCDQDGKHFEEAGSCSSCGMQLVDSRFDFDKMRAVAQKKRKEVAILVFPGVQIIDYTGPYEVFGQAGYHVFLVAEADTMIQTAMGMQIVPHYTLDNSPPADIIVIPGGNVRQAQNSDKVINWIRKSEPEAESVMSVCNGAYILAETGLLDGKEATTFASLIDGLRNMATKTKVVEDQRFVDNGKIVTTAGLSSGLDGSLHVVAKMMGLGRAQMIATNLEYNWDIEGKYVRAALADRRVTNIYDVVKIHFPERTISSYEGDENQWTVTWEVEGDQPPIGLVAEMNQEIASKTDWQKGKGKKTVDSSNNLWYFTADDKTEWSLLVEANKIAEGKLKLLYHLEKIN